MKPVRIILFLAFLLGCVCAVSAQSHTKSSTVASKTLSGHQYVDLGLPSGTLWATCNIGAETKTQAGQYFAWGETRTKSLAEYCKDWYKHFKKEIGFTKYAPNQENYSDEKRELDSEDDVAYVKWGENWQIPSLEQIKELANKKHTTWKWTEKNNIYGHYITSKINGVTLFLPATGYASNGVSGYHHSDGLYWSRDLATIWWAYGLSTDPLDYGWTDDNLRTEGRCVRPVVSNVGMRKLGKSNVKFPEKPKVVSDGNNASVQKEKTKTTDYVAPVIEKIDANKVYDSVDEPAQFNGGESAMQSWIKTHQVYPEECEQFGIKGRVRLSCVINQDGSITDIQSIGSSNDILVKEATRVVRGMPKWIPAKKSGTSVKSRVEIPFLFK